MPTDFGIAGSRNYKTDLAAIDESKARSLLLEIKAQVTGTRGTKRGVLKLVNLQGQGNITLERKGLLTRMFQRDGRDMRTTAVTLEHLFDKAGFSAEVKEQLSNYLARRTNRAGTKTISKLITEGFTRIGAASGADVHEALHKLGVDLPDNGSEPKMKGTRGKVVQANHIAERRLFKANNQPIALKLHDGNERNEPRLHRSGAAGSAYLENRVPGIVRPTIYTLLETRADNTTTHHAVSGDKHFKRWAAQYLASHPGSTLAVTGTVMSRARGVELMDINKGKPIVAPVQPNVLHRAALDGLETLKKMSASGFVHGDLKSPNMFIDTDTQTLQFIDVDEISKMRKGQAGIRPSGVTSAFSHPNAMSATGKVGFEQDLMGLGISILHTALENRGDRTAAERLQLEVYYYNQELKRAGSSNANASDPGFMKLRALIEGTVPADASPVEILAVNWINAALDHSAPVSVRYGTQGDAEHLLDRVDPGRNPAVSERIDRRTGAVAAPQQPAQQRRVPQAPVSQPAQAAQPKPPQQPPQKPAAAQPSAARPDPAKALAETVERELDSLSVVMDKTLPPKTSTSIYLTVAAWTKGPEGQAMAEAAARDARGPDDLTASIRDMLIDRINLEHLRLTIQNDSTLSALPEENQRVLEQRINLRATFEKASLMSPEQLATRIERIRQQSKI